MTKEEERAWKEEAKEKHRETNKKGSYNTWLIYMNGHVYDVIRISRQDNISKMLDMCLKLSKVFPSEDISLRKDYDFGGNCWPLGQRTLVAEILGRRD